MTRPAVLPAGDRAHLAASLDSCPALAALQRTSGPFARMMTGRRGRDLETWMNGATASGLPELRSFVTGCTAANDAVIAGLAVGAPHCASRFNQRNQLITQST